MERKPSRRHFGKEQDSDVAKLSKTSSLSKESIRSVLETSWLGVDVS